MQYWKTQIHKIYHSDVSASALSGGSRGESYVEPGQAALRSPEEALFHASCARLQPVDGQDPVLDRPQSPEVLLLLVDVGRDIVAEQAKETGDRKGLVAVAQHLEVQRMSVEIVG